MRLLLVSAFLLIATPAFAEDDFLKQLFDADGPTITDGQPTGEQADAPDDGTRQAEDQGGEADPFAETPNETDPACGADRYGVCPELLSPEDRADYDAAMADGPTKLVISPFERAADESAASDDEPAADDQPSDDPVNDASDETSSE